MREGPTNKDIDEKISIIKNQLNNLPGYPSISQQMDFLRTETLINKEELLIVMAMLGSVYQGGSAQLPAGITDIKCPLALVYYELGLSQAGARPSGSAVNDYRPPRPMPTAPLEQADTGRPGSYMNGLPTNQRYIPYGQVCDPMLPEMTSGKEASAFYNNMPTPPPDSPEFTPDGYYTNPEAADQHLESMRISTTAKATEAAERRDFNDHYNDGHCPLTC